MVQLVSEYVQLEQRGAQDFWGRCPFHDEKSASFHVLPGRGIFKCFGCGKGGDIFSFVSEVEGVGFADTVRLLAQRANVELEEATPQERARAARKQELQRATNLACEFFASVLWSDTPAGARGRAYLQERGITDETARAFRLGVAPPEWDALTQHAAQARLPFDALREAGLARQRDGRGAYDFFRDRLMFPICDVQGRVVAFGGRTLCGDERKYMNSPEVPGLYEKRRLLYGLDHAKRDRPQRLVVVEGYMDVVIPHQAGRTEFVAALGTAFTPEQAKLAGRYVDEVVLLFDGDEAGAQATLRALAKLVGQAGITIRVARLPAGVDPDDAVRKDPALLENALTEADDVVGFLVGEALRGFDRSSPAGRERVIKAALKLLAPIPDPIRLSAELNTVAERFGVPETVLREELTQARRPQRKRRVAGDRGPAPGPAVEPAGIEERLLEAFLAVPDGARRAQEQGIGAELFSAGPARAVASAIFTAAERGPVQPTNVLDQLEGEPRRLAGGLIGKIDPNKDYEGDLAGVARLVQRVTQSRLEHVRQQLSQKPDPETERRLLEEWRALNSRLQQPGSASKATLS
ncbi:MAG: DNA primase [Planctomycetes bacterium]|nr:DNA primase [Planctomycetota bacterium]